MVNDSELEYVGFWPRAGAQLIDGLITLVIIGPILTIYYGEDFWLSEDLNHGVLDFLLSYVFPIVATVAFWVIKQATPGKMAISSKLADAATGNAPSLGQCIGRYFAYILSILPLGLGFIWVAFDSKKQGWHDKLAGTVVIRLKNREAKKVTFNGT